MVRYRIPTRNGNTAHGIDGRCSLGEAGAPSCECSTTTAAYVKEMPKEGAAGLKLFEQRVLTAGSGE